jgi:hypothetical protein
MTLQKDDILNIGWHTNLNNKTVIRLIKDLLGWGKKRKVAFIGYIKKLPTD